jgi:murein L,D-transpeptidase YafK
LVEVKVKNNASRLNDTANFNYKVNPDSIIKARNIPFDKIRIMVSKTNYTFQLLYDTFIIKTYPCIFGTNPVDDKRMEGDRCTPEGSFKVIMKFAKHEWYKFIWFDYPNMESWKKFNDAKAKGEIPLDANIGGKVGIHGVGKGDSRYDHTVDERDNWTWGCIHLKNKDLDEVFNIVQIGTEITIRH